MVGAVLQMEMEVVLQMEMEVAALQMELQEHPLLLEAVLMSHPTLQPQQEQWQVR